MMLFFVQSLMPEIYWHYFDILTHIFPDILSANKSLFILYWLCFLSLQQTRSLTNNVARFIAVHNCEAMFERSWNEFQTSGFFIYENPSGYLTILVSCG